MSDKGNPIRLVVGLGNPGREYEATRHNAGFWLVDQVADARSVFLRPETKFQGLVARFTTPHGECWLLEPQTFMNCSGRSVAALARFYKITPEEILVVHDELDLPPGTARVKKGGSTGGHNGLKDISAQFGTHDYWRLRIGIGHPGTREAVVGYVLNPPRKEEMPGIEESIEKSVAVLPHLLAGEFGAAMMKLHTKGAKA